MQVVQGKREPGEAAHHGSSQLSTAHARCPPSARTRPILPTRSKHLLKLLHREALHSLRGRLRLEHARLLGEGLMPLRAFVAGLFFSFMFSMPANLKEPDFFTCSTATPMNASPM